MSLPKNAAEIYSIYLSKIDVERHPASNFEISLDWLGVNVVDDDSVDRETECEASTATAGLRVRVGAFEFEADADFPMEKLTELLRGLEVDALC